MMNKKGGIDLGNTITWVFAIFIVLFILTIYVIATFSIKATLGNSQKEVTSKNDFYTDSVLTQNLINIIRSDKTNNKDLVERICRNYYLLTAGMDKPLSNLKESEINNYPRQSKDLVFVKEDLVRKGFGKFVTDDYCGDYLVNYYNNLAK